MKVLVTGATGFTGIHVVPRLLAEGIQVRCLVRDSTKAALSSAKSVQLVTGRLEDPAALQHALRDSEALINIASLGFGHAPGIIQAAREAGVMRCIFISTTAIFTSLNAPSKTVRLAAENAIIHSGLTYTILRPTMIYGTSRDRNICRLIRFLARWPAIPIFGTGDFLQQPVLVTDLADAIVRSLLSPASCNQSYNISGSHPLTYNQIVDTISEQLHRPVRKIHIPARVPVACLRQIEKFSRALPIKAEQIERLNEHKAFSHSAAAHDFGFRPRTFEDGVRLELEEMGMLPA